jgi:O-antigen ligase
MGLVAFGRHQVNALREAKLPFLLLWVGGATVVACFAGGSVMDFQLSGLTWFFTLLLAILVLLRQGFRATLPILIWLPWMVIVATWWIAWPYPNGFQRSVMLLCPIIVGLAVSSFPLPAEKIGGLGLLMRFIAVALWVMVVTNTGLLVTGTLPMTSSLASQSITASLLCCYFAAEYAGGDRGALRWWGSLAFVPVVALTRTAMVAAGVTLPLSFARLKLVKRAFFLILMSLLGLMVFYTPRMQEKMFRSGHGNISDLRIDNQDLQTSGRAAIWEIMDYEIEQRYWLGHGANASEKLVRDITGGLAHPHNDWLRLRYDYGVVGTAVFIICMSLQSVNLLMRARKASGDAKVLLYAGASSFLPFAMLMYTDNIILYAAFFGNLQFALIGIGYSSLRGSQHALGRARMGEGVKKRHATARIQALRRGIGQAR